MDNIYEMIAKEQGVTAEEVKKELQNAIDAAFAGEKTEKSLKLQSQIPHEGEIPTVDEFISFATAKILDDKK